jgi:hypothetical protein
MSPEGRPNILLLMVDQLAASWLRHVPVVGEEEEP